MKERDHLLFSFAHEAEEIIYYLIDVRLQSSYIIKRLFGENLFLDLPASPLEILSSSRRLIAYFICNDVR